MVDLLSRVRESLGYWDAEGQTWWTGHSSVGLRLPITVDVRQLKLALGITCPRHRAIWKRNLGPLGRCVPEFKREGYG